MDIIEEKIVKENVGLIWQIAKNFYGIDKKDLFQAGALGIVKAYRNYKKNGTTKFSSYAYDYILGEMYNLANNKMIKVSRDLRQICKMIEKARFMLAQKTEKIPTNQEVADFLEMDIKKIELALQSANMLVSLDEEKDEARNYYETIAAEERINQDDRILLESAMNELQPLEKDIIAARYYEDLTQSETARKLGVTQVMVSRYEARSLEKMHEFMYM